MIFLLVFFSSHFFLTFSLLSYYPVNGSIDIIISQDQDDKDVKQVIDQFKITYPQITHIQVKKKRREREERKERRERKERKEERKERREKKRPCAVSQKEKKMEEKKKTRRNLSDKKKRRKRKRRNEKRRE